ncbi:anaerobic ribonucleoside-triphosphate reductase [Fusobacterium perfoetens]|uniref:anaerobic ribonucleoside-triphosphate reductase n=1 Tax=Fusobacterium perfoetens TaxID=852 RepID=UPI00056A3A35|nr:anaerobic ribonucleoside-triphosphate reductase [Fusobacterium perfoetens]
MKVIKRNGDVVAFNKDKIFIVLQKVHKEMPFKNEAVLVEMLDHILNKIKLMKKEKIDIEEIQDIVFKTLCDFGYFCQAQKFERYRTKRSEARLKETDSLFQRIEGILENGDRENSNKNSTLPSVARDLISGEYFRFNVEKSIGKELYEAHRKKTIHWHDSDVEKELTNCCLINVEDMLDHGTRITNTDVETPKSVGTAMNIAMQIMASVSSQQYGGNSIPNFNEVFAKYAKKNFVKNFNDYFEFLYEKEYDDTLELDSANEELKTKYPKVFEKVIKKTAKEIYDACQLFEYQTNSILGSASQTPFSTITFNIPTSWESEQIILAYLKVRQTGLGALKIPAIFPKLSYIVVDGYNLKEGDPYYYITKEVSKCIAHTYYPDLLFYSKEDYDAGKYYARMGCRSRVNHEFQENGKYQQYGRFNFGVITLNLPQIALESLRHKGTDVVETFMKLLEEKKSLMKLGILKRYENVRKLKAKQAPILFQYGAIARLEPNETVEKLLKSDRASVSYGFLGIDDCVRILTDDKQNISKPAGRELGLRIMKEIRKQADEIKEETGLPVSVYGTPAEASIATFFNIDKKNYSDVMPEWLLKREYYTNSFHFSSELPIDAFDKIDVEAPFIKYCNGGNIMYVENGGKTYNSDAILELMRYAHDKGIEYFAVNTVSDVCFECGYTGEISYDEHTTKYKCPQCGNEEGMKMKIQRRCCGYISNYNITHALEGRMKEIKNRAIHVK